MAAENLRRLYSIRYSFRTLPVQIATIKAGSFHHLHADRQTRAHGLSCHLRLLPKDGVEQHFLDMGLGHLYGRARTPYPLSCTAWVS